jgi:O-antigen/teichoic acid export membrane protein
MNPSHKIIKNTFWLTIQPIVLNVISLFIIGYITRTLGESDYGNITFAFAFPFLFSLLTDLGIKPFLTRIVVDMKSEAVTIIGKIVCFRLFLSILSYLLVVLVVYTFYFSESVRIVVCIAGLTLIFNAITNTMNAVMQGYEKMESVALAQFYSGLILTIGSVLVLLIGFRLTGLTVVYTLGSFLWMVFAIGYCMRIADIKPIFFDFEIVKIVLKRGFPFFLPGICSIISTKSGVIILAKVSGDASLGLFTAANNLIEKLTIIPDGICTSVFPALSGLHQKNEEFAQEVTRKAVLYLFLLSLPLALGFIILSQSVIVLIYGADFVKSAAILRILSIGMIFMFLMNLEMRILAAIRLESKGSVIFFLTSVFTCYHVWFLYLNLESMG